MQVRIASSDDRSMEKWCFDVVLALIKKCDFTPHTSHSRTNNALNTVPRNQFWEKAVLIKKVTHACPAIYMKT